MPIDGKRTLRDPTRLAALQRLGLLSATPDPILSTLLSLDTDLPIHIASNR